MKMLGIARPSDAFLEAMLETLIALAIAAAICVSVISLSAHLNDARTVRAIHAVHHIDDQPCKTWSACS
jgi:hypothetical protein